MTDRKDKIIIAAILAALAAILGLEWFRSRAALAVSVVTGAEPTPSDTGPASAWANVPTARLMLPPGLGGYVASGGNNTTTPDTFYNCEACG